ncbi:carotenoid oxygenase family protein [Streptomyces beijiangensis]|uniref:Dioxygenase n=1 Tax=Streptomyces beijiangensis TaxID=163361 RepID=A0A939F341_9ACTN|nr:carotenoid oxygenase family protein [Streptomyces beijiangensis]MBO0510524.1 carotenoid oxygenase family protein [Streptomyces beijiangensis]
MTDGQDNGTNPYLSGLFAPVREEVTAHGLDVTGRIPDSLNGRYLRNGPNPLGVDDPAVHHWFSGAGMVHGVRLRDGRAEWYRNRWVRSDAVAEKLGEKPFNGPHHQNMDFAANTHILRFAGRHLATVEGGTLPYELDEELNTLGPYDFQGTLPGGFAAHTVLDPASGELHAVAYCWAYPYVQYLVAGVDGRIKRRIDIPVEGGPMMHDFSLTERYVLLYDLPVGFSMEAATSGSTFPYAWDDRKQARIGVLPREGQAQDVLWLDIDPCFVFHPMNAYETDGGQRIVVDLVRYEKLFSKGPGGAQGPGDHPPRLERWTVDLAAGSVRTETLDDRPIEFPRVDPRRATGQHRFGYGVLEPRDGYAGQRHAVREGGYQQVGVGLIKYDLASGGAEIHRFHPDGDVGEGVFVPASPDAAEDDGWVLTYAFDPERQATDLVVLAAGDFTAEPVARIHLPVRVPVGFHGNWIPDEV